MKSNSPVSHEVMNAELLSESSSSIPSSSISGIGSGTEGTVYDRDDETNPCGLSVDAGLSSIPDDLCRLWNFAGNRKSTSQVPHPSPNRINGRAETSAHDDRIGAHGASTQTEPTPADNRTLVLLDEGIWMKGYQRASLTESHSKPSVCCKFHAAGKYAIPSQIEAPAKEAGVSSASYTY